MISKNIKLIVNKKQSIIIQKYLFKNNFKWAGKHPSLINWINSKYMFIDYDEKEISTSDDKKTFLYVKKEWFNTKDFIKGIKKGNI
jgi:hypothetical protein